MFRVRTTTRAIPPERVTFFGLEEPRTVDYDTFSEIVGGDLIPVPTKVRARGGGYSKICWIKIPMRNL